MKCVMCDTKAADAEDDVDYLSVGKPTGNGEYICEPCLGLLRRWKDEMNLALFIDDDYWTDEETEVVNEEYEFMMHRVNERLGVDGNLNSEHTNARHPDEG